MARYRVRITDRITGEEVKPMFVDAASEKAAAEQIDLNLYEIIAVTKHLSLYSPDIPDFPKRPMRDPIPKGPPSAYPVLVLISQVLGIIAVMLILFVFIMGPLVGNKTNTLNGWTTFGSLFAMALMIAFGAAALNWMANVGTDVKKIRSHMEENRPNDR